MKIRGIYLSLLLALTLQSVGQITTYPYTEDFEQQNRVLNNWSSIDADQYYSWIFYDWYDWTIYVNTRGGHNNSYGYLLSESYHSLGNTIDYLEPDEWLITPKFVIPQHVRCSMTFYAMSGQRNAHAQYEWAEEEFQIHISETYTGGQNVSDTQYFRTKLASVTVPKEGWKKVTTDLTAYSGKSVNIAIRHYHPNSQKITDLLIDDFSVTIEPYDTVVTNSYVYGCDSVDYKGVLYTSNQTLYDTTRHTNIDTIRRTFITINHSYHESLDTTLNDYGQFTWHGTAYTASTQFDTVLRTSGGCDSILHLDLKLSCNRHYADVGTINGCDSMVYAGTTYNIGSYDLYDTTKNSHYCDSISHLQLVVTNSYSLRDTITQRDVESIVWHQKTLTQTGIYYDSLTTANGCDSIHTLKLLMINSACASYSTTDTTVCDSLLCQGNIYRASQNIVRTLVNAASCDSIDTLRLVVKQSYHNKKDTAACELLRFGDSTYTNTAILRTSNLTADGCDSIDDLELYVGHNVTLYDTLTNCGNLLFRGVYFDSTDNHTYTPGHDRGGCDSTIHLHVVINPTYVINIDTTACDTLTWQNETFLTSADYSVTLKTQQGCDSVLALHLRLNHSQLSTLNYEDCDSLTWHGTTFYNTTTHTISNSSANGCDSNTLVNIIVHHSQIDTVDTTACDLLYFNGIRFNATSSTLLKSKDQHGCDSSTLLNLTMHYTKRGEKRVTACESYQWKDIVYTESTIVHYLTKSLLECDSTITLILTINRRTITDTDILACDSAYWYNRWYSHNCVDTHYFNDNTCRLAEVMHLKLSHAKTAYVDLVACDSLSINGTMHHTSATLQNRSTSADGCDSTAIVTLKMYYSSKSDFYAEACDSFLWHGTTYRHSTDSATYTRQNYAGCDSVITLHFHLLRQPAQHDTIFACDSYSYNDSLYTASTLLRQWNLKDRNTCDSMGSLSLVVEYSHDTIYHSYSGCDSFNWHNTTLRDNCTLHTADTTPHGCITPHLHLIDINHSVSSHIDTAACDSLVWMGIKYNESTAKQTFGATTHGCDSITSITITIHRSYHIIVDTAVYDSLVWMDSTYYSSAKRDVSTTSAYGCDSSISLSLYIITYPAPRLVDYDKQLLMVNHYPYGEDGGRVDYYAYRWYCDSALLDNETSDVLRQTNSRKFSGCYYAEVAVDRERRHWLRSDTICYDRQAASIVYTIDAAYSIYPNPVHSGGKLSVRPTGCTPTTITLYDQKGTIIIKTTTTGRCELTLPNSKGIYMLLLDDGTTPVVEKIVII